MKAFLPLLLSFFFIISCQQHKEATISPIDEEDELQRPIAFPVRQPFFGLINII